MSKKKQACTTLSEMEYDWREEMRGLLSSSQNKQ